MWSKIKDSGKRHKMKVHKKEFEILDNSRNTGFHGTKKKIYKQNQINTKKHTLTRRIINQVKEKGMMERCTEMEQL